MYYFIEHIDLVIMHNINLLTLSIVLLTVIQTDHAGSVKECMPVTSRYRANTTGLEY